MQLPASNKTRAAFTLIELLVVITIIAILVALLSAGIMMVFGKTSDVQNANDINQLGTALTNFKVKFNMYPPSRIRLVESGVIYNGNLVPPTSIPPVPYYDVTINTATGQPNHPLDFNSVAVLKQMWQRIGLTTWPTLGTGIDWNGDGLTTGNFYLEGDQCLVFFLGGIQTANPPATLGFSTNPQNPAALPTANNQQRIGPFYNFQPNRLVSFPLNSSLFYSYLDIYGDRNNLGINAAPSVQSKPFAYFSSLKGQKNMYNPYLASNGSDCHGIGAMPYCAPLSSTALTTYLNPDSYQLISAGADKQFGSVTSTAYTNYCGVIWDVSKSPATFEVAVWDTRFAPPTFSGYLPGLPAPFLQVLPNGTTGASPAGNDDRTNFCPNILVAGNAQN